MITKSEWLDWKSNNVTKEFIKVIYDRIEEAKEVLSARAGLEPRDDGVLVGMIHAFREILDFRVDFDEVNKDGD